MADITALYLVKQLELAVRTRLDALVGPHGLTALQYTALTVLERSPGLTSADLARNSFVRPQTMVQTVIDLERRGLLQRTPDARNQRQQRTTLTPEGAALLDRLREPVAAIERAMLDGLPPERVDAFRDDLRACRLALAGHHPH